MMDAVFINRPRIGNSQLTHSYCHAMVRQHVDPSDFHKQRGTYWWKESCVVLRSPENTKFVIFSKNR